MTDDQTLLACIRKADFDFGLINDGDRIMVGLSGGKDSMVLVRILNNYRKFRDKNFSFVAVFLDLGFDNPQIEDMKKYAEKENFELVIYNARDVAPILRQHKQNGLLPCSICSRMKKACINQAAHEFNITKVAFAHHADDAIETLFMNMIYGGRVATFAPKMFLSNEKITFIRPLIYAREEDIIKYAKHHEIPIFKNNCGNDKKTKREEFKQLIKDMYKKFPEAKSNYLTMITNVDKFDLWFEDLGFFDGHGIMIKKALTTSDILDCLQIRKEVFIKEQGVNSLIEFDENDKTATHFLLTYNSVPCGTIRIIKTEDGYKFTRLAVLKEYRGKGLGTTLVHFVEKKLSQEHAPLHIVLDSQLHALDFYKKLEYKECSEHFTEAGIEHVQVEKTILKPIMDKERK